MQCREGGRDSAVFTMKISSLCDASEIYPPDLVVFKSGRRLPRAKKEFGGSSSMMLSGSRAYDADTHELSL